MARGDRMGENYDDYLRDDNLHINWYPGHMKKTRDLVRNNLKLVDVVVELLDSRIPFSSRNPDIDNLAGNKPRVVILNKCDLADRAKLDKWIKYYKDRGIKAIPVDTLKGVGLNKLVDECRNAVKDKMDALKEKGRKEIVLTCLDEKVEMYKRFGFVDLGMSDSVWGGEEWHEMTYYLR